MGEDVRAILEGWINFLRAEKLWGLDDPLFPATRVSLGEGLQFEASGLARKHWSDAGPIRRIFKETFRAVGLPYFNPHSFRKTLALLGERLCRTPEEFKAWSQNLGHEQMLTTFYSYGAVAAVKQAEIIRGLAEISEETSDVLELAKRLVEAAERHRI